MNLIGQNVFIVDIECDGLLEALTKHHVLSAAYQLPDGNWTILHTADPERIKKLIGNPDNTIIGHNFIGYDKRALEKLGFEFNAQIIDTLGLSWYLYPDRPRHGLAAWGEDFGVPKPEIEDWEGLTYEEYAHRCNEDVKINLNLWLKIYNLLVELYAGNLEEMKKVIGLCNFLLEVLVIQEENPVSLNVELAQKNLITLENIIFEKSEALKGAMPEVDKLATRKKPATLYKKGSTKPKKMFTKAGELTSAGEKWMALLEEHGLPEDHEDPVQVLSNAGEKWVKLTKLAGVSENYEGEIKEVVEKLEPNPSSTAQVKDWLTSLGWKPHIFNEGANGPVPQLRDQDKNLCESVLELIKSAPEVEYLEGLSVAQHRAGVLKGFIATVREDGTVVAGASKFTRTFRYAHKKPIVNLPSNTSTHGELIRICLEAPEGFEWVNADLDALEDRCKQIQVTPWASYEYLNKPPDYDPHIEVAIAAGLMSPVDFEFFKWFKEETHDLSTCPEPYNKMSVAQRKEEYVRLGDVRKKGKVANYSCIYGVGPSKLSKTIDTSQKEAKKIIDAYWEIHKPVKDYSATLKTKTVDDRTWVYNPFTKLWLNYKGDHNLFSACTQNFGAVVHARMMYFLIQNKIMPIMNIHDEESWYWPVGQREECKALVKDSIDKVNNSFGFDIKFGSEPEFASSYGKVH